MTKSELATVVTAVAVAASGAVFGAFLAVSQVEEQIHKYFGGKPVERDQEIRVVEYPNGMSVEEAFAKGAFNEIRDGAPWRL
ncbi:hypothetical protein CH267_00845 [Rhodococcus sp. 06-621-2]|nr:hypothetical protein [Rhodococcus sp. 06-621-2]OZC62121.1 hypothetical protein CH267_00845 [Rhodococcus sp. 06-621-2]